MSRILGITPGYWYKIDSRHERFVNFRPDPGVPHFTWKADMYNELVRAKQRAHVRIFVEDLAYFCGLFSP